MKRGVMPKELRDKSSTSQGPRRMLLSSSILELVQRCTNEENETHEAPWIFHSNASRTNEFEDPCKELWRKHWVLHILKFQDRFHHWGKMDVTLLFKVRFGKLKTCWKGNFVHCVMEYSLGYFLFWTLKRKIMEWRQHRRVIKKEIAMKQKDSMGKSCIKDQL
jgi:hypothetical protein